MTREDTCQGPEAWDGMPVEVALSPEVAQSAAEARRVLWGVGLILFHVWLYGVLSWNTRLEPDYTYGALAGFWLVAGRGKLWVRAAVCGLLLLLPFSFDRILHPWSQIRLGAAMAGSLVVTLAAAWSLGRVSWDRLRAVRFSTWQLMKAMVALAVGALVLRPVVTQGSLPLHAWQSPALSLSDDLLFGVVTGIACLPLMVAPGNRRRWWLGVLCVVFFGELWQLVLWNLAFAAELPWSSFTCLPRDVADIPIFWLSAGVVWVTAWSAEKAGLRWLDRPWEDEAEECP